MTVAGQPERATQNRIIALFCDQLDWCYLGDILRDGAMNDLGFHRFHGDLDQILRCSPQMG